MPTTEEIAKQFAADVSEHEITILHNDGVYRHVTLGVPGSGIDRFTLTTFPGALVFSGDRGTYVFERTDDMFTFFRRGDGGINPGYLAEKCVAADRRGIKEFSAEAFKERIREELDNIEADAALRAAVESDLLESTDEMTDESAHAAVNNFEHDGVAVFKDSFELDFTEYTYRFIWCLLAIVWGIAQYDAQQTGT